MHKGWLTSTIAATIFTLIVSVSMPSASQSPVSGGYLMHILAFMVIGASALLTFSRLWQGSAYTAGVIVLIEIIQAPIPYRTASLADIVAGLVGLALAWCALMILHRLP